MSLKELFISDYEQIRYKQSGREYEGYVKIVNDNFIEARICESNGYEKVGSWFDAIIYKQSFKGLEMEWWFEGQGCDNSAIGVSGCWESIADFI